MPNNADAERKRRKTMAFPPACLLSQCYRATYHTRVCERRVRQSNQNVTARRCPKMAYHHRGARSVRLAAFPENFEGLFELRAHRDVEAFAVGQPRFEPTRVDRPDVAGGDEITHGAVDAGAKFGLVAAEHNAVGIVGEEFAYDLEFALRTMLRDQAIVQHFISREGVSLAIRQHAIGLLVIRTLQQFDAELELLVKCPQRLRVGGTARHDHGAALQITEISPPGLDWNHQFGAADKDHRRKIDEPAPLQVAGRRAAFEVDGTFDDGLQP